LEILGEPPRQYLKARRLEVARDLLIRTDHSIKEIAHSLGLDVSHFGRDFKARFGVMPAKYRAVKDGIDSQRADPHNCEEAL
jgi:AraC-like DNA-binding protein